MFRGSKHPIWLIILSIPVLLAACTGVRGSDTHVVKSSPTDRPVELAAGETLNVVATTNLIGDVVSNVAGNRVNLIVLIQAGQDPHTYQLTARQRANLEDADLVFVNGFGLEESLLETVYSSANGSIVVVSSGILPRELVGRDDTHSEAAGDDPHVWMDVQNVQVWAHNIASALAAADPANAAVYTSRADDYSEELRSLDEYIRQQIEQIPLDHRKMVTDHDALGYFADAYGVQIVATVIPGFSTASEATASDLVDLVATIDQTGVSTLFIGATSSGQIERLSEAVAAETGHEIKVLRLYTGSLDALGTAGDTYIGMMRFNAEQIAIGLTP